MLTQIYSIVLLFFPDCMVDLRETNYLFFRQRFPLDSAKIDVAVTQAQTIQTNIYEIVEKLYLVSSLQI